MKENYPDFKGKVLSITIKDDTINRDLIDPHFENQAGRIFIIGTVPKGATESDWVEACKSSVAWDRITDYFTFDSLEEYSKAIQVSEDYHKDDAEEK